MLPCLSVQGNWEVKKMLAKNSNVHERQRMGFAHVSLE